MEEDKKEVKKEEKHEEHKESKKEKCKFCKNLVTKAKKIRKKTFAIATIILSLIVVGLLILMMAHVNVIRISSKAAGNTVVNFLNDYITQDNGITLNSTEYIPKAGFYYVSVLYKGSPVPVILSSDGKYIDYGQGMINIRAYIRGLNSEKSTDVPATDTEKDECSASIANFTGFDIQAIEELAFSTQGIAMLEEQETISTKYGVSGSPTLIINGKQSSAIYSGTDSTKAAICSAFTTKPTECNGVTTNSSWTAKSSKPIVELFVMSYCPYGVRAEENIAPLQELFGNKIDLKVRYIVNVNGDTIEKVNSLHGLYEAKEDARQLAIAKLYPDKLWDYLAEFNRVCYGGGAASAGSC